MTEPSPSTRQALGSIPALCVGWGEADGCPMGHGVLHEPLPALCWVGGVTDPLPVFMLRHSPRAPWKCCPGAQHLREPLGRCPGGFLGSAGIRRRERETKGTRCCTGGEGPWAPWAHVQLRTCSVLKGPAGTLPGSTPSWTLESGAGHMPSSSPGTHGCASSSRSSYTTASWAGSTDLTLFLISLVMSVGAAGSGGRRQRVPDVPLVPPHTGAGALGHAEWTGKAVEPTLWVHQPVCQALAMGGGPARGRRADSPGVSRPNIRPLPGTGLSGPMVPWSEELYGYNRRKRRLRVRVTTESATHGPRRARHTLRLLKSASPLWLPHPPHLWVPVLLLSRLRS